MEEKRWEEKDGVIYLSVTSTGITGRQWYKRLTLKGIEVHRQVKAILRSEEFDSKVTNGKTYKVAIIRAWRLPHKEIYVEEMVTEGKQRGFVPINPEAACLILDQFSEEELKEIPLTFITLMSDEMEDLLVFARNRSLGSFLSSVRRDRKDSLLKTSGFAFEDSGSTEKGEK